METIDELVRHAELLVDLRKPMKAEPILRSILSQDPVNEDGLMLRARIHIDAGRYQDAVDCMQTLLAADPTSVRALMGLARGMHLVSRTADGIPYARRFMELMPESSAGPEVMAMLLSQLTPGSAEALRLLEEARRISPEDVSVLRQTAAAYLENGRFQEAEPYALEALRNDPADSHSILQLGLIRAGLRRFDESRDAVAAALRMDPHPDALDGAIEQIEVHGIPDHLAELYRMLMIARGRPDLSRPGAAGTDPRLLAEQAYLARQMTSATSDRSGRERAGLMAEAVLEHQPENQHARYVMARRHGRRGEWTQSLALGRPLLAEGYDSARLAVLEALEGLGDMAGLWEAAQEALAAEPLFPPMHIWAAQALRGLGRPEEAVEHARRAVGLNDGATFTWVELAECARALGDTELEAHSLGQAQALAPADQTVIARLARLHIGAGRGEQADRWIALLDRAADPGGVDGVLRPTLEAMQLAVRRATELAGDEEADGPAQDLDAAAVWFLRTLELLVFLAPAAPRLRSLAADWPEDLRETYGDDPALPGTPYGRLRQRLDEVLGGWSATATAVPAV